MVRGIFYIECKEGIHMNSSQYIAVFHSLSYAGQVRNRFWSYNRPQIIKTPKAITGGCSYALVFSEEHKNEMLRLLQKQKKGFLGIYQMMPDGRYKELSNDLPG